MNSIRCGFAQRVITPCGEGIFMDGYGHRMSPAEGLHDDLYAKAAVFGAEESDRFAVIVLDVCGFNAEIYELLTDYIEGITGLDKSHVAVCAIHTHAAPACGVLDGLPISYDFWCHTAELCGRTILDAMDNMCECSCSAAIADSGILSSFNRRNRPFIDRRIKASVFIGQDGNVRGVIASACCHPVINTAMELSADYPQVLTRRSLEEYGVPFLFLQGRGADINPLVPKDMSIDDAVEKVGKELADGVMNAIAKAERKCKEMSLVRSVYKYALIPMKDFGSLDNVEKDFKSNLQNYLEKPWSLEKHYALRELEWHRKIRGKIKCGEKAEIRVPIQLLEIGKSLVFVFLPFEILTNTGNKIEEILRSMDYEEENIFVIGYANSVNSYLTPLEELPIGGYEVTRAAHWYGLPECGELTEKTVIERVKEMVLMLQKKTENI